MNNERDWLPLLAPVAALSGRHDPHFAHGQIDLLRLAAVGLHARYHEDVPLAAHARGQGHRPPLLERFAEGVPGEAGDVAADGERGRGRG